MTVLGWGLPKLVEGFGPLSKYFTGNIMSQVIAPPYRCFPACCETAMVWLDARCHMHSLETNNSSFVDLVASELAFGDERTVGIAMHVF